MALHPNHGGNHDDMVRLNEAKRVALKSVTQLVHVMTVQSAIETVTRLQEDRRLATERSARVQEQLRMKLQGRLRRYRLAAAMVAVVAAAAILLGRDIPTDVFDLQPLAVPDVSVEVTQVQNWVARTPDYTTLQATPILVLPVTSEDFGRRLLEFRDEFLNRLGVQAARSTELATGISQIMARVAEILYGLGRETEGQLFLLLSELELLSDPTLQSKLDHCCPTDFQMKAA